MQSSGYSQKPLVEKLGYMPGDIVCLSNTPGWFKGELESNGIQISKTPPATWAHCFFTTQHELADFCERFNLSHIEKGIWFSWPKKDSGIATDLTEQSFRDFVLPLGWVDTKVAAIDDTWSGLKFLRRKS